MTGQVGQRSSGDQRTTVAEVALPHPSAATSAANRWTGPIASRARVASAWAV